MPVTLLLFPFRSGKIKVPEWAELVKTSKGKEQGPFDQDWYFIRCGKDSQCQSSILNNIALTAVILVFAYSYMLL